MRPLGRGELGALRAVASGERASAGTVAAGCVSGRRTVEEASPEARHRLCLMSVGQIESGLQGQLTVVADDPDGTGL